MQFAALAGLLRSLVIYYNPAVIRQSRALYRGLLGPGDLAIDVGAHVGTRARAMRAAGARVVALEPQPVFARFLRRTLPRDIRLIEAAAGPAPGQAAMTVSRRHPTVSSLNKGFVADAVAKPGFEHVRWDAQAQVAVTTLDAVIADHGLPALIKIDVEGFELEVLAGLSQPVRVISVEYLPGWPALTLAVLDRLCALGAYRFNAVRGEHARFEWQDWQDAQTLRDWLAALPADAQSGDLYARLEDAWSPAPGSTSTEGR